MIFNGVHQFLNNLDLGEYWDIFKAKGFDRDDDLLYITKDDLILMDISENHMEYILEAGMNMFHHICNTV